MEGIDFSTLYIGSPLNNAGGKLMALHGELVAAQGASGGTAVLDAGGSIEFGGPTTTAVQFADSQFNSAALVLDDSVHFKGVISGFGKANINDTINLLDIDPTTAKATLYPGIAKSADGEGWLRAHRSAQIQRQLHGWQLQSQRRRPWRHADQGSSRAEELTDTAKQHRRPARPVHSAWTNPSAALTSQLFSALATELQTAISLPHAHG
jgi:hypothetical protein